MPDIDRRSLNRRAHIIVRMSHKDREAIRKAAARQGMSVTELVHERLADILQGTRR